MPTMKAPYTFQHISLTGHSVEFEAGVPTHLPNNERLVEECLARGAIMCDEPENKPAAAPAEKVDNVEDDEAMWAVALDKALMIILTRDDPADLKTDMTPKVTKVTAEMSPELRRPTATEVSDAYQRLQESIDLAD